MLPVSTLSSDARSLEWGLMIWIPNMLQVLLGTCFEKPCSRALTLNWSTPTCGGQNFARGEGSERVHWNLSTPPYLYVFFPKTPLRFPSEHAGRQSPLPSHIALSHFAKEKHAPHPFLTLTSSVKPSWILNKCSKVQPMPLLIRAPEVSPSIFSTCVCERLSHIQFCDPLDWSPPGSSVHGILQARILEWVTMPSSRGSSWPRD